MQKARKQIERWAPKQWNKRSKEARNELSRESEIKEAKNHRGIKEASKEESEQIKHVRKQSRKEESNEVSKRRVK